MNNLNNEPKTTVIIDGSVVIHALDYSLTGIDVSHRDAAIKAQMTWLMSLEWMSHRKPSNYNTIIVQDTKREREYWRHKYLKQPHIYEPLAALRYATKKPKAGKRIDEILYKGGRKLPDQNFKLLKRTFYNICKQQGWPTFGYSDKATMSHLDSDDQWIPAKPAIGYEADDCAAAIVHINNKRLKPNRVWLATIDADWLGMVNDHTSWICTGNHTPRLRIGIEGVNEWASHRLKTTFDTPTDIWRYKALHGDASDNLPPYSPIEVIDLFNPPDQHKVWNKPGVNYLVNELLNEGQPMVSNPDKASAYLRRLGCPKIINPIERPPIVPLTSNL